ncbi:sensor histidine kinase [Methylocystis echinoides]|uniref:histidine kinase n=1 Tax=Methylocystis echinoides TaxID=29468 RepID=A0A9W6GZ05_9HYPH|nr:sensor histidine kinase KdpD [Methylocystis echinoides]GLI95445.1 histidine kinase [Methylocystis echinoides]
MAAPETDFDRRPDPEALLALAEQEKSGKLCVFLGAAPGVGKTYAMLRRARSARDEGIDVVIGLAETHGRRETEELTVGLEVLPRRKAEYKGRTIEEFDIDAALARKPQLIIVDELAHTNAPDSRHPKRWQDVDELLRAGVNVWTALNIQHLESLADIVSKITGVSVRETVPDRVLQEAADVVLVDITPDELLQRLKEGKVYVPETAQRAIQNFFTPRNLTALRELALRRTADRVDDQMVGFLRQGAIEGPWATTERLLACVGPDASSQKVVRIAARLATGLNAPWIALHVARAGDDEQDAESVKQIHDALHLAERLGAQIERISGSDLAGEVLRYARRENITQIVVGRSRASYFGRLFRWSLTDEIVRRSDDVSVQVVMGDGREQATKKRRWFRPGNTHYWTGTSAAILSVALTVCAGYLLDRWLSLSNLSVIFLVPVVLCAAWFGLLPAIMAAVLGFFACDFFFVDPRYQLTIRDPSEFLALVVFLVVAFVTGMLASRVRQHSEFMRTRAEAAQSLFEFSRNLSGAANLEEVLWAAVAQIQKSLDARCVVLIPNADELAPSAAWPPLDELDPGETSAARWTLEKAEPAGWRTGTLPNVRFQFRPLSTTRGVLAVAGVQFRQPNEPLSAQQERTLTALLEQTAIAIDRSMLVGEAVKAAALEENEKLRMTLLSSLSHDLRTPLTSITGAVTSLRQLGEKMSQDDRQDLLASIEEETGRLSRFISNLIEMSRIEAGAVAPRREFVEVGDAVRAAVERSRKVFPDLNVSVSLSQGLPLIKGDVNLLSNVLFNLLDNANKYGGGSAAVYARREGGDVVISVTDEGQGVKPVDLERIFEKFYRGGRVDGRKAGTGLGLSICRGLVGAMGGTIIAQSPAIRRRGTRLVLRFPIPEQPRQGKAA